MKLFAFGLGYSALHFIDRQGAAFESIVGTVRTVEKAAALEAVGVEALVFGPETENPAIEGRLAAADAILVSVQPGISVDPVLARFGRRIAGLRREQTIVYLSTVGVYGDHRGEWIDENTLPLPVSDRSKTRLQAEKTWLSFGKDKSKSVHVLRLAGIYGPGRNALVNLAGGKARRLIKQDQVFNRIHVEDIGNAIAAAFTAPAGSDVWNVCDDEPAPPQDVIACAAAIMGITPPPEESFETAELTPMARSFYGENKRVSNRRLKEELGVVLAYPTYREGLTALWEAGEGQTRDAVTSS